MELKVEVKKWDVVIINGIEGNEFALIWDIKKGRNPIATIFPLTEDTEYNDEFSINLSTINQAFPCDMWIQLSEIRVISMYRIESIYKSNDKNVTITNNEILMKTIELKMAKSLENITDDNEDIFKQMEESLEILRKEYGYDKNE